MSDFEKWTIKALKEYCKENNIKIPTNSKKAVIIDIINNNQPNSIHRETLTEKRQKIIKNALIFCRKEGKEKILDFFERRNKNSKLKHPFEVYKLNLDKPSIQEIRVCLKYYQEVYDYDDDDKLFINQMIAQPKYIKPEYIDPRLAEFQQFEIISATYDIPGSTTKDKKSLNKIVKKR